MISAVQNTPKLRFPEFSENWNEKKLGGVLDIGSGRDYKHLNRGDIPVYGTGGYMLSVDDYLYEGESVCIGRKGTIDNPIFLTGKFWTVDTLFYTHNYNGITPQFIFAIFQRINWVKYNEASGVPSLSKNTIEQINISTPQLPEQKKIAAFLGAVDAKIGQLTRKKALLEDYKKGCMQQLFTQKLRFKDDQGNDFPDWESLPLSSLSDPDKLNSFTDGDWIESPHITDEGNRLIQTGNIGLGSFKNKAKKYISDESYRELKCKEVEVGDLLICRLAEPAGRACVVPELDERRMLTSVDITIVKVDESKTSAYFLAEYFSLDRTLYEVESLCGGSTRTRIARSNLAQMKIPLPHPDEQQKIADFLSAIDAKIGLVADELSAAQDFKKGLLQQMFV